MHHIRMIDEYSICVFCLNNATTSSLEAHTARALRPGRRLVICYRGDTDGRERTALAIVADSSEWLVVSSTKTYKLVGAAMIVEVVANEPDKTAKRDTQARETRVDTAALRNTKCSAGHPSAPSSAETGGSGGRRRR